MFIQLERETVYIRAGGGAEREREKENPKQTPHCQPRTQLKAQSHKLNCEIMTWAEIKSRMFNQLSHPGAPDWALKNKCLFTLKERESMSGEGAEGERERERA